MYIGSLSFVGRNIVVDTMFDTVYANECHSLTQKGKSFLFSEG